MSYADVAEGVRAAIAAYSQAVDDGRTDDVVATFVADGEVDIPGLGTHQGHDALRQAYAAVEPRVPQRHLVLNTLITDWTEHAANAVSDLVMLSLGQSGWDVLLVGRYSDTLQRDGDTWRFSRRAAKFVTP